MSTASEENKSGAKPASEAPRVTIYTDGAAEPNPGTGGYGVVLISGKSRKEISKGFKLTTNNRMELLGVIAGLEALKMPCSVTIISDSRYVVEAIDGGKVVRWQKANWYRTRKSPAKNSDLWQRYLDAAAAHQVKMEWIKGHAGHEHNERCDVLAVAAAKSGDLAIDEGYRPESQTGNESRSVTLEPKSTVTVGSLNVSHKHPGEPCRKCATPIVKRLPKKKTRKAGQSYYYEWYLHCPNCKTMYMVEEAKRTIELDPKSMFDDFEC